MLRSLAPCAIARTLMRLRASASKSRAATPGVPAMPSPTTASTAMSRSALTSCTWPRSSSRAKASLSSDTARSAWRASTTQQIECSEEPCEIITTEIPARCSAANTRSAVPGTPIMPAPSTLTSASWPIAVMPLTGGSAGEVAAITLPGCAGLKVLRMRIGIWRAIAGCMVCGWMTLAPK